MEDNQLGQHFWNFLTKPKSKASYEETEVEERGTDTHLHNNHFENAEHDDEETITVEDDIDRSFHNDFECMAADEETAVRSDIDMQSHKEYCHNQNTKADYSFIEVPDQGVTASSYTAQADYPYIDQILHTMKAYSHTTQGLPADSYTEDHFDYGPFKKATREGNWSAMKEFIKSHPEALAATLFPTEGTALHYSLSLGEDREEIAACLVERMTPKDLEIKDAKGYTPLATASLYHHPKSLLQRMIEKNSNLPNIGEAHRIPVVVASWKGYKDTTRFLYHYTDKNIFSPEYEDGKVISVYLLHHCVNIKLFDIALELVEKFPGILLRRYNYEGVSTYPTHAFATMFSTFQGELSKKPTFGDHVWKYVCHLLANKSVQEFRAPDEELVDNDKSRDFLQSVCKHLSDLDTVTLKNVVSDAMIEAAKNGNIEFIIEMLKVDRELILAENEGKNMFWHAVVNRHEKVFNLIYGVGIDHMDSLLSFVDYKKRNNMLHCAAKLPRLSVLDRTPGRALQMQREIQWFKEVSNVGRTRYRGDQNFDRLTPHQMFIREHKVLMNRAEASMKDTAKAATTVGTLIITTMFAAAFTVTSGNNQMTTNYSSFATEVLFNIFIVCDALSLCSSTTAILVFLGILTSPYSEDDYLFRLPRKFMIGFYSLFTAIATMMMAFCSALAIVLEGRSQLIILLICMLLFVPFMFGLSSICPLLRITFNSTYGPSIFDKSTKLPKSKRASIGCCY